MPAVWKNIQRAQLAPKTPKNTQTKHNVANRSMSNKHKHTRRGKTWETILEYNKKMATKQQHAYTQSKIQEQQHAKTDHNKETENASTNLKQQQINAKNAEQKSHNTPNNTPTTQPKRTIQHDETHTPTKRIKLIPNNNKKPTKTTQTEKINTKQIPKPKTQLIRPRKNNA